MAVVGVLLGLEAASSVAAAAGALELGKGAIIGAMLIGAAFLAGVAVLRRSAAAACGLLLVAGACGLQAVWLKIVPAPSPTVMLMLESAFAAAALLFLSATIGMARRNQLMGGILFAAALSMLGVGVINAVLGGEAAGLQRIGMVAVAALGLGLSAIAGAKGDVGARLVLPGAALATAAPFFLGAADLGGAISLAPQAVFSIGVLLAGLVALVESGATRPLASQGFGSSVEFGAEERPAQRPSNAEQRSMRVSENRLADVLDYSGVAVWDWDRNGSHQSSSFARLMRADCDGAFTPEVFREFVHADDAARIDDHVFAAQRGDGGFDETIRLVGGQRVRIRGARAVHCDGNLERIVVFLEEVAPPASQKAGAAKLASSASTVAAIPAPALVKEPAPDASSDDIGAAFDRGEVLAAFQPIVGFEDGKVRGAEALARWPAARATTADEIVRTAQLAGKGYALFSVLLSAAARHASERIAAGENSFFVSLKVSPSLIRERDFVEDVKTAIGDYKLPKGALVLEPADGFLESPKFNDAARKLRAAGVAFVRSDAGNGSFADLRKFEFDYLKLGRARIADLVTKGGKKKNAAALARLGRDYDLIAEGVDSKEAAEAARAIGCRMGEGSHLGRPQLDASQDSSELATIEVLKSGVDEIVLDRSMTAPGPRARRTRQRMLVRA